MINTSLLSFIFIDLRIFNILYMPLEAKHICRDNVLVFKELKTLSPNAPGEDICNLILIISRNVFESKVTLEDLL